MNWLRSIRIRLRALLRKRQLDAEMDDEMRSHIEMRTQANIEAGMNPEEARFAALRQFGWTESIKETLSSLGAAALRDRSRLRNSEGAHNVV